MLIKPLADKEGSWKMTSQKYKQENKADIPTYNLWRKLKNQTNPWNQQCLASNILFSCCLLTLSPEIIWALPEGPPKAGHLQALSSILLWKYQLPFQLFPEQGHRKWHIHFKTIITNVRAKMGDRKILWIPIDIAWWQNPIFILYIKNTPKCRLP